MPARGRASAFNPTSSKQRWLFGSALPVGILLAVSDAPQSAFAQSQQQLNPVFVSPANPRSDANNPGNESPGAPKRARRTARQTAPKPAPTTQPAFGPEAVSTPPGSATIVVPTPLNGNLVATSPGRLGLTVHGTPAS